VETPQYLVGRYRLPGGRQGGSETATMQDVAGQAWAVTERLVGNLVWSLGTASHYRAVLEAPAEP
jgi:hypothetical protein